MVQLPKQARHLNVQLSPKQSGNSRDIETVGDYMDNFSLQSALWKVTSVNIKAEITSNKM